MISPSPFLYCTLLLSYPFFFSGPEAATAMRKMGYTGLIIGVTGHAQRADIEEFERCGADAVLAKPLKYEILNGVVNNYLV